jgi:hypothetical protein
MNRSDEAGILAKQAAELLSQYDVESWAQAFDKLAAALNGPSRKQAAIEALGMYGGMGSFNDLVLHFEGDAVIEGNNKLDRIRQKLFMSLREIATVD